MLPKLSIIETIDFWGGFKLEKISDSPVQYADICTATLSQADYLPHNAKVASVHVGFISFIKAGGDKAHIFKLKRATLAAQAKLQKLGYTHIALTGPLPQIIDINKRLKEVGRHKNNALVVIPNVLGACCALLISQAFLLGSKHKLKRQNLRKLLRISPQGFREHIVYRL